MNALVLFSEEIDNDTAILNGSRAEYALTHHTLKVGSEISYAIWEGTLGEAIVEEIKVNEVSLRLLSKREPIAQQELTLIVSVPRPQTQKKVIHLATVLGVKELHFIRSAYTEKSYLMSHTLKSESINYHILRALEQCKNSLPPKVEIFDRFKPYIEDTLSSRFLPSDTGFLLSTCTEMQSFPTLKHQENTNIYLAIGPESGWNDFETETFINLGFNELSLGKQILRVETATAVALGQISLLKKLDML
ncbi:MAG: 16S rRNA (uracil(1498)-N(3))-methyltransferase [Deltaproteobacteria bacterium]|nr:16S rRNA (uracil(1498)-N(3))-methyltransferase [Deltaproteobacteria bacterium]